MNSLTEENYLKAIYKLSENEENGISTNAISELVKTKAATVTDMLRKLSSKQLIKHEKYYGVSLTDKGRKSALAVVRKHRLWELFLVNVLKFKWDEVHSIAEQLEHIQSDDLTERLDKYLGYPKSDPHGDPIPDQTGKMRTEKTISVSSLKEKSKGIIAGVSEHSPAFLQYLEKNDLGLGNSIEVIEINEFDSSVNIKINNRKSLHVSQKIAKNILIKSNGK